MRNEMDVQIDGVIERREVDHAEKVHGIYMNYPKLKPGEDIEWCIGSMTPIIYRTREC